jgi:hypothetical protein
MELLLGILKEDIAASVLSHILICLSYLSKDRFTDIKTTCQFNEKINDFIVFYKKLQISISLIYLGDRLREVDKKNNLDLCAYLYNPKIDKSIDKSKFEVNNLSEEVIFESFPDEIN